MEYEVGDIVMCTVERIQGTTVFVNVEGHREGYIVLSEIAPGRIRNLRDYVVPKKTIVCKVLRKKGDSLELSLRRVTPKEQKQIKEKYKQEKSYKSILKTFLKDKAKEIIEEIQKTENVYDFLEQAKQDPKILQELMTKPESDKILEVLNSQKQKKAIIKKIIKITTKESQGLTKIKNLLSNIKNVEIKYISAGKYSFKTEASDIKKADIFLKEILENLEKQAKKENIEVTK